MVFPAGFPRVPIQRPPWYIHSFCPRTVPPQPLWSSTASGPSPPTQSIRHPQILSISACEARGPIQDEHGTWSSHDLSIHPLPHAPSHPLRSCRVALPPPPECVQTTGTQTRQMDYRPTIHSRADERWRHRLAAPHAARTRGAAHRHRISSAARGRAWRGHHAPAGRPLRADATLRRAS
jgi:hypothetical protein